MKRRAMVEPEIRDHCPESYNALIDVCHGNGIKVDLLRVRKVIKKKRIQYKKYPVYDLDKLRQVEFAAVFSPYATSHKIRQQCKDYHKPLLHMEHGFLPSSLLCDITGFWGDSYLVNTISQELDKLDHAKAIAWADEYSSYLIENNISKRSQPESVVNIEGDFVFLPMQYMQDQSIFRFTKTKYVDFVNEVAQFCADRSITLAIKKHPHAYKKEPKEVDALFKAMRRRYGDIFQPVDGSVHQLCRDCLFMSGMNTGSIVDGCINGSVISHCGQSLFMNSGAVCHDDNVGKGLSKALDVARDEEARTQMNRRQKLLLYFLYNRYLLLENDTHKSELSNEEKIAFQLSKKGLV